ncbi:uncharacterized protein ATNIH1004_008442 [Aspergillus tanneri]|uniref:Uncharacterized protein n=1 Tax=Aspergillus tanneri TaxID=1220188 RepID=A0A5M9MGY0_9EURO|nr:uncharacterized protein ATNIH1004_008442 [Aspergillus tanneri]KAA8644243.1 hypothetical protein ATNIH1004_008442 [Aspergillus tanneri]
MIFDALTRLLPDQGIISQNLESDDDLDFIDHRPQNRPRETCEVVEIDDDSDDNANSRPSYFEKKRARGVRFEKEPKRSTCRQKDSAGRGDKEIRRNQRSRDGGFKGNKKGNKKQQKERHKTLTQMDYVRRYLKIEPDEDVKLEYTYITPKKENAGKPSRIPTSTTENPSCMPSLGPRSSSENKRRRLDIDQAVKDGPGSSRRPKEDLSSHPVTPQKPRRSEIPSSQSPESPGFTIISSSQFRGATRSSLGGVTTPSATNKHMAEESPTLDQPGNDCSDAERKQSSCNLSTSVEPLSQKRGMAERQAIDSLETQTNSTMEHSLSRNEAVTSDDAKVHPANAQRTVVYETDAETDYGDIQDALSSAPGSPLKQHSIDHRPINEDEYGDFEIDNSQDLPPMTSIGREIESDLLHSDHIPPSDASICYQRMQLSTQFPLEPIPILNTQKMAELFPDESNCLRNSVPGSQALPETKICEPSTQTQSQSQTQTQSQSETQSQSPGDMGKLSTVLVPESSPIIRNEDKLSPNNTMRYRPRVQEAVVQVESSQPADKVLRQGGGGMDSRILSEGQILTSSVMESVPMPALWLGSEDSVGEPYEMPDA